MNEQNQLAKYNDYLVKSDGDYHFIQNASKINVEGGGAIFVDVDGYNIAEFMAVEWIRINPDFDEISDSLKNIMIG